MRVFCFCLSYSAAPSVCINIQPREISVLHLTLFFSFAHSFLLSFSSSTSLARNRSVSTPSSSISTCCTWTQRYPCSIHTLDLAPDRGMVSCLFSSSDRPYFAPPAPLPPPQPRFLHSPPSSTPPLDLYLPPVWVACLELSVCLSVSQSLSGWLTALCSLLAALY